MEKSDAMKQQENMTEEILRHRPKRKRTGGPIEPWHGLIFLALLFVLMIIIGSLIHN
jgi:hypothetical protein